MNGNEGYRSNIDRLSGALAFTRRGIAPYLVLAAVFLLFHTLYNPFEPGYMADNMRLLLLLGVLFTAAFGFYLWLQGQLTYGRAAALIMAAGVLIRIAYALYTNWNVRQHDMGGTDSPGHMGYIVWLMETWSLPDEYRSQLYHPPLHHFIAAVWLKVNEFFLMDWNRNAESLQYVTAFYSSCMMVASRRIFKELNLKGAFLLLATALTALHPTFVILGGSINNDMLSILFYTLVILRLIKWYKDPGLKNIIPLALCLGFGMMTKLSVATSAFVIAPVFLVRLFGRGNRSFKQRMIGEFLIFGGISIPLGLWHSIRNYIELNQPLGYVLRLGTDLPLYTGDYSLAARVFSFPFKELFARLYADPYTDYNLPIYTLKCSLFGEFSFNADVAAIAVLMTALNIALILMSLAAMAYTLAARRERQSAGGLILFGTWLVQIVSMIIFYIQYPFGCTMDFRYLVPTVICGAGFIGLAFQRIAEERPRLWGLVKPLAVPLIAAFVVFSSVFYLMI